MTRKEYQQKLDLVTGQLIELLEDARKMIGYLFQSFDGSNGLEEKGKQLDTKVREKTSALMDLCTEIVTLQQPMASDVRLILSTIRIKNDVERSVRDSLHIVQLQLSKNIDPDSPYKQPLENIKSVLFEMIDMLENSINEKNSEILIHLSDKDEIIDQYYENTTNEVRNDIKSHPDKALNFIDLLLTIRMIERIADHLCNIAEKLYYIQTAKNVRIA